MPHTLYIIGQDEDENSFDYVVGSFTVSGAPYINVATPMSAPYVMFSGISALTPGLVNISGVADWADISVVSNASPVARISVKFPDGTETVLKENPLDSVYYRLARLTDGRYEVTVIDAAGNRTFAAFSVGALELTAVPEESTAAYNGSTDLFGAQFKFHLRGWYPLEKAELFDGGGTLLRTDALTANAADITYSFPDLFSTDGFTRDFNVSPFSAPYTIKLYNKEGHKLDFGFALAGAINENVLAGGGTADLLAAPGLLAGALGRTKAGWLEGYFDVGPDLAFTSSGPLVNVQQVGSFTVAVLTGANADLSDGVEKLLARRSYTPKTGWCGLPSLPRL